MALVCQSLQMPRTDNNGDSVLTFLRQEKPHNSHNKFFFFANTLKTKVLIYSTEDRQMFESIRLPKREHDGHEAQKHQLKDIGSDVIAEDSNFVLFDVY